MFDRAIAADPANPQFYRTRAQFNLARPTPDLGAAAADYQRAIAIDPNNVQLHLELAYVLVRAGEKASAAGEYRQALKYNSLLDPEEPKRLTEKRIAEIEEAVRSIEAR
jgi:Flp pilus assembly protein TadD